MLTQSLAVWDYITCINAEWMNQLTEWINYELLEPYNAWHSEVIVFDDQWDRSTYRAWRFNHVDQVVPHHNTIVRYDNMALPAWSTVECISSSWVPSTLTIWKEYTLLNNYNPNIAGSYRVINDRWTEWVYLANRFITRTKKLNLNIQTFDTLSVYDWCEIRFTYSGITADWMLKLAPSDEWVNRLYILHNSAPINNLCSALFPTLEIEYSYSFVLITNQTNRLTNWTTDLSIIINEPVVIPNTDTAVTTATSDFTATMRPDIRTTTLAKWSQVECINGYDDILNVWETYRIEKDFDPYDHRDYTSDICIQHTNWHHWIYAPAKFKVLSKVIPVASISIASLHPFIWRKVKTIYQDRDLIWELYEDSFDDIFILHNDYDLDWYHPLGLEHLWYAYACVIAGPINPPWRNDIEIFFDNFISTRAAYITATNVANIPTGTLNVPTVTAEPMYDVSGSLTATPVRYASATSIDTVCAVHIQPRTPTVADVTTSPLSIDDIERPVSDTAIALRSAAYVPPQPTPDLSIVEGEIVEVTNESEYVFRIFVFKDKNWTVFTVLPEDEEAYKDNSTIYELEQWKKVRKYFPKKKIELELTDWEEQMLKEHLEKIRVQSNTTI